MALDTSIQNYIIEDNVIIQDVFLLKADQNSKYGNGIKVSVLNEAGGREVVLFDELNAQIAYLQCFYKDRDIFQQKLHDLVTKNIKTQTKGTIKKNAVIRACKIIKNVNVGPDTVIEGATELSNGTILSCSEHLTFIGPDVIMKDFIVAEGATITDGPMLENVFVGQGVQIGKQFSAENSLFFANSEAFHSEACSIFAGPYSVTHHRSTLLIGCLFSFYNAGSGTNQSNHMYKLGPVHQGILERGCKTGSFSYLLLESHLAPFSVVIGKHLTNVNIPNFPFSHLSEEHSASNLIPGKNLFSIGTTRDGVKWPDRDRRRSPIKRDLINFDVFSPFTVEKMRIGKNILQDLYANTPKGTDVVSYGGIFIKRLILRKGAKYYKLAIDRYLIDKVLCKVEKFAEKGMEWFDIISQLKPVSKCSHPDKWIDLAGLLALNENVENIIKKVESEQISAMNDLTLEFQKMYENYYSDEWIYVCHAFQQEYGTAPHQLDVEKLIELVTRWGEAASSLNALTMADAKIEFADFSQIGFGLYGEKEQKSADFKAVRGSLETNAVINQLEQEYDFIKARVEKLLNYIENKK